jgi:thiamine-monophosphate kinase
LDVSDGLIADLNHICEASDLGAVVDVENLPLSPAILAMNDIEQARIWALSGGDDYELCFTVPPEKMPELAMLIAQGKINATVVGEIVAGSGVKCELDGAVFELAIKGFQHF